MDYKNSLHMLCSIQLLLLIAIYISYSYQTNMIYYTGQTHAPCVSPWADKESDVNSLSFHPDSLFIHKLHLF